MPSDKDRARWFIKNEWRTKRIPHPTTLLCMDCNKPAAEYDHYLGYAPEHYKDVESVCRSCHHKRGFARGERQGEIAARIGRMFRKRYHQFKAFAEAHPKQFQEFCNTRHSAEV